ncbi:MAG TPA: Spy/CpxP family protein refolding chaperone [Gemmatimonadales bacterium]|nr:Spy/CpxP family protein refolding chaperone [Gemmatimonadales bacterium]
MRLRLAVLTSALVLLGSSVALAQGAPGPGGFAARRMQRLLTGITLTPEQQTKVDSITARYAAQMPAFTPGAPPDSTTRAKMRDLNQKQDGEVRALLTADQQKVWDANVEAMRNRMQRPPGNR